MANKVLSIEIGQTLTKVCEVEHGTKNTKVFNCFSFQTPKDMLEDGYVQTSEEFANSFREKCAEYGIKNKNVIFTISSTRIANREILIPLVKENRIKSVIQANSQEYFPMDISTYQFTYSILDVVTEEDKKEKKYKLLVLAAPSDLIESYYSLAAFCGLTVVAIDYNGNSLFQAVKNQFTQETSMVIKVDEFSSLLLVIKNQSTVLQRNISYGADIAIQTMIDSNAYGENLSYEEAANLFRKQTCILESLNAGESMKDSSRQEDTTLTIDEKIQRTKIEITDSLRYLINNIMRVIDYYNSRNQEHPIEKIVLTGLGGDLSGFSDLLSFEVGQKVLVLTKINATNIEKALKNEQLSYGEYVTAIGAAIAPLGFMAETVKLIKDKKDKEKDTKIGWILLIGGLAISIVLILTSLISHISTVAKKNSLETKISSLEPVEVVFKEYQSVEVLYEKMQSIQSLTELPNDHLLAFIQELEEKMPANINVLSFTATTK
ncbi:hypothetical protein CG709_01975, partial [Lachnotalea glycerini]